MKAKRILSALLALLLAGTLLLLSGCDSALLEEAAMLLLQEWASQQQQQQLDAANTNEHSAAKPTPSPAVSSEDVEKGQPYYGYKDVSAYLYRYGELPPNYVTKAQAKKKGWDADKGNLWKVLPGACIGGDRFGNYEGKLPSSPSGQWYECDVEYEGGHRGAHRLVYSGDGVIYYTADHYNSFERLY